VKPHRFRQNLFWAGRRIPTQPAACVTRAAHGNGRPKCVGSLAGNAQIPRRPLGQVGVPAHASTQAPAADTVRAHGGSSSAVSVLCVPFRLASFPTQPETRGIVLTLHGGRRSPTLMSLGMSGSPAPIRARGISRLRLIRSSTREPSHASVPWLNLPPIFVGLLGPESQRRCTCSRLALLSGAKFEGVFPRSRDCPVETLLHASGKAA
jgi:hypothetical protein